MIRLRAGLPRNFVSVSGTEKTSSLLHNTQIGCGSHTNPHKINAGDFLLRVKGQGLEYLHFPHLKSRFRIRKARVSLYFMSSCHAREQLQLDSILYNLCNKCDYFCRQWPLLLLFSSIVFNGRRLLPSRDQRQKFF